VLHGLNGRLETATSFQDPAPKLWGSICSGGDNCAKSEVVAPGIDTLNGVAETSYASCGDLSLAYQLFGDGPVELVFAGSFVSHVELFWTLPEFQAFMEQLSTFCRVLVFDKAGVGLSDPVPQVRTLDDRAAEIEAVMDAVGFGRAALFGVSEGGPAAMVFAATRPERTRALILTGSYSFFGFTGWDDIERDPAELRARILPELGADYTPSTEQIVRLQELGRAIRSAWGGGAALRDLLPSVRSTRQLAMLERMSASPGMARATIESAFRIDVRPILSTIRTPTLVIHASGDLVPVQGGQYLADHIPGARWLEVDGTDNAPWFTDPDAITSEIEEFLTGSHAAPSPSHRALRTVLFTDMVASTAHAAATGDERWRAVLQRFGEVTADLTNRFGGTVVKSTGDGHLATFDGPTQAIRCAEALRADAETLSIEIRAGIHTGECELLENDIAGLAVHIAARILGQAGASEILVSRTVRDLVVGSGTGFEDRGSVELRGLPGSWQLLAVDRHGARTGSAEAELASTPTPGPRTAMRRSDRAPGEELLGRDEDLAALAELVDGRPLVTIVGPGGVGKTTLAREVTRRRASAHGGGARIVELAAVTDSAAVPDAVVTALGLTSDGGAPLALLRRARFMDLVVLLDNCEHVLDAVCEVLDAVLGSESSAMRLVATSRELLGMPGECAWPLQPLDCSRPDSPAQQFFRRRADAARPGAVTAADLDAITAIVRRLDGLPLAIELAAAQVATLGIADLGEQIEASVANATPSGRLSRRGGEPRHRTLRAAIEWSERLLADDAKDALAQWTVFAGAVRLSDAQAVLQVAPEVIDELAIQSLLSVEIRSGRTYYRMLQTVRSVVGPVSAATERRHLEYFSAAAAQAAAALQTPDEAAAHQRLVEIVDELRLAHTRARRIDIEAAVRMSMSLHWFAVSRLHTELLGWATKLAPLVQDRPDLRAAVDSSIAYRYVIAEQLDSAQQRARSALADAADDQTRCRALEALGDSCIFQGDLDQARSWWSELVTVGRRAGETYYELIGHVGFVMALAYGSQPDAARRYLAEIDGRFAGVTLSATQQSWLAYLHGEVLLDADPITAMADFTRAIDLADAAGSHYVGGVARVSAITLQSRTAPALAALPLYVDVIERWLDAGSWSHLLTTMRNLVPTLTEVAAYSAAAQVLGAVTRPDQTPTYGVELERLSAAESALRARLGAADFEHERAVGSTLDLAASGRAAITVMRGLLDSLQPVEPEEVVLDAERSRPIESG